METETGPITDYEKLFRLAKESQAQSDAAIALLEQKDRDFTKTLSWIAQTVHQAYHLEMNGTWRDCPKSICDAIRQLSVPLEKK